MKKWYIKIWNEGKYIDLWSVVHTMAGVVLYHIFFTTGLSLTFSALASFFLMVLWEIFEIKNNVKEKRQNRVMDVILGMTGFMLYHLINQYISISHLQYIIYILIPFVSLNIWGYFAYKAR